MDWYPKNPTDYREDTWHLTLAEHGAYNLLIDHYMNTERPLPDNDLALARIVGVSLDEWLSVEVAVVALFSRVSNTLQHKRCDAELMKSFARRKDGGARQKAYRNRIKTAEPGDGDALVTGSSPVSNAPIGQDIIEQDSSKNNMLIENERFDAFWSVYPRKVGKKAAKKSYLKAIKENDPSHIQDAVVAFAKTIDDIKFCAHPATWLNGERWNDDLAHVQPKSKLKQAFEGLRAENAKAAEDDLVDCGIYEGEVV